MYYRNREEETKHHQLEETPNGNRTNILTIENRYQAS
jgi:hypothetical protein